MTCAVREVSAVPARHVSSRPSALVVLPAVQVAVLEEKKQSVSTIRSWPGETVNESFVWWIIFWKTIILLIIRCD